MGNLTPTALEVLVVSVDAPVKLVRIMVGPLTLFPAHGVSQQILMMLPFLMELVPAMAVAMAIALLEVLMELSARAKAAQERLQLNGNMIVSLQLKLVQPLVLVLVVVALQQWQFTQMFLPHLMKHVAFLEVMPPQPPLQKFEMLAQRPLLKPLKAGLVAKLVG